jgi:hypothetical protein
VKGAARPSLLHTTPLASASWHDQSKVSAYLS